jgi:ABC-type dipeptide/oligopeptide/nickel transport system permease component
MAEEMFMYTVTAGIFAFLVAVLFGTRAARKRKEPEDRAVQTESSFSGSSGSGGKRIKRFKSDGTPVYD